MRRYYRRQQEGTGLDQAGPVALPDAAGAWPPAVTAAAGSSGRMRMWSTDGESSALMSSPQMNRVTSSSYAFCTRYFQLAANF